MNVIDFTFQTYRRSSLYLKRSKGAPIPKDHLWRCPCGLEHPLTDQQEQYCTKCGCRLRLQEQREDDPNAPKLAPGVHRYTLVRVSHFTVYPDPEE